MNHLSFFWNYQNEQQLYKTLEEEFSERIKSSIESGKFILPPIPTAVVEIQKLCQNENTTINEIAESLLDDPSLTAVVLKIANSVVFNRRGIAFHDIHSAISRLGMFRVRDIVTAQSIEQLKLAINLNAECNKILKQSAAHSRELSATMVLVVDALKKIEPEEYAYLEHDKALLVGLLADIGLFCLISEYHLYLEQGNYLDQLIALKIFESCCADISQKILISWGFDHDYTSVAGNLELSPKIMEVSYLDIAKLSFYLLLYFKQNADLDDYDIELNADCAEVLCDFTNLSTYEFDTLIKNVINTSGF